MNNAISHHGILGMKWGIRRYQNKDGSLTPAGIKRYRSPDGSLNRKGVQAFAEKGREITKIGEGAPRTARDKVIKDDEKDTRSLQRELDRLYRKNYDHDDHADWIRDNADPKEINRIKEINANLQQKTREFIEKHNKALLKDIDYKNVEAGMMYLEAYLNEWKLRNPGHFYEDKKR